MTTTLKKPVRRRIRAWRHRLRNARQIAQAVAFGDEIVLVYQMGKVGSSSVRDALQATDGVRVFQTHWCNEENLRRHAGVVHEQRRVSNRYGDRTHAGPMLRRRLIETGAASKVVTMVRDPMARNVSSYFQHLDEIWGVRRAHERVAIEDLLSGFIDVFEHDEPLTWFQTEIQAVLGVDLLAEPFDRDRRWSLVESGHWSILIFRTDLPDEGKRNAMCSLMGRPITMGARSNDGRDKKYAEQYRAFKEQLRVPDSLLSRLYDSPVTQHFFRDDEIAAMRARWKTC